MTTPIVFLDTETTGLTTHDDIWEFAAIRQDPDGTVTTWHTFVKHNTARAAQLPEPFHTDHQQRYDPDTARSPAEFAEYLRPVFEGRPHLVGAVPDFDTRQLRRVLGTDGLTDPWHYHLTDAETLAVGYLRAVVEFATDACVGAFFPGWTRDSLRQVTTPPWDSEELSRAIGVNPDGFARHTAMGDVQWAKAIYDLVMVGDTLPLGPEPTPRMSAEASARWRDALGGTLADRPPTDHDIRATALLAAATRWAGASGQYRVDVAPCVVETAREFEAYLRHSSLTT